MTKDKFSSDPSMDEILASIRQIMSDESKGKEKSNLSSVTPEANDDILDLTHLLSEESFSTEKRKEKKTEQSDKKETSSPFPGKDPKSFIDSSFKGSKKEHVEAPLPLEDSLISEFTASETAQALRSLNQFAQGRRRIQESSVNEELGSPILENHLREMLRPLLKEWLDIHLPSIVRWVVNEQVEKIMRQGGILNSEQKPQKPKDYF